MAEPIGALRVDASANFARFEDDMGKIVHSLKSSTNEMQRGMESFRSTILTSTKSLYGFASGIAGIVGVGGLVLLVKKSIEAADAVGKAATRTGLSVEAFQELSYAAKQSAVDQDEFIRAFERLNNSMAQAEHGTKTMVTAFSEAGVTMKDIRNSNNEQIFLKIADGVKATTDAVKQADIVSTIFGVRFGSKLLPLFKEGAGHIAELRKEAQDFGLVLDTAMVQNATKANDQLLRMEGIIKTNLIRAVVSLTPEMLALGDAFIRFLKIAAEFATTKLPDTLAPSSELARRIAEERKTLADAASKSVQRRQTGIFGLTVQDDADFKAASARLAQLKDLKAKRDALDVETNKQINRPATDKPIVDDVAKAASDRLAKQAATAEKNASTMIKKLEQQAAAEDLIGTAKEYQNQLDAVQNALVDEHGKKLRELLPAEKLRIFNAVQLSDEAKHEVSLKQSLRDLEKANRDTVIGTGTAEEIKRAIIEQQNLLYDEQGNLIRELSDTEKERIANTVLVAEANKKIQASTEELANFAGSSFQNLGDAITNAFVQGGNAAVDFGSIVNGVLAEIAKELIKLSIINPLQNAISGNNALPDFGSVFGALFGGGSGGAGSTAGFNFGPIKGLASGGMHPGGFRVVGEHGPELESTGASRIFNADQTSKILNGGGNDNVVTVNVFAPPGSKVDKQESTSPGGKTVDIIIDEAVAAHIANPSSRTSRAMRNASGINPILKGRG